MSTSKEVFALRKAGQLDEAYEMAAQLNDTAYPDIWDMRAFGWCLVDLIDREFSAKNYQKLKMYGRQLERIEVDESGSELDRDVLTPDNDAALIARRKRALSLVSRITTQQQNGNTGTIITYKDIYAKRKENIDEAYKMALQATAVSNPDIMELHAFAWCLIDCIKRDFVAEKYQNLEHYCQQLQKIIVNANDDDILTKQRNYALSMCEPSAPIIFQAQAYSQQKNYTEAIRCYNKLFPNIPQKYHISFGWDLYRHSKQLLDQGKHTIPQVKRYLQQYLKLGVDKPSKLHSTMLWIAKEIARNDNLDMGAFLSLWGINAFREEDFERGIAKDGRQFPALAEDVFQRACKAAIKSHNTEQMQQLLPFLEKFINRYEDNIWLVYYKAKILLDLGHIEEAQKYCRTVCKNKQNEFWAWELLGDAYADNPKNMLACYSKGLLCSAEKAFTVKLRCKIAQLLAKLGYYPEAKFEIATYIQLSPNKLAREIFDLTKQNWFQETLSSSSNGDFYTIQSTIAEKLLLQDLPWVNAIMGEQFTISHKEGKPLYKRKIYIMKEPFPLEVSCSEKDFPFPNLPIGSPIQIKGEFCSNMPYQILSIALRENGELWDIFTTHVGIISFVNRKKRVYHILVNHEVESFFNFDQMDGHVDEGDFVAVKLARFNYKQGKKYKVIMATKTDMQPSNELYKIFNSEITSISGGMGFTSSDIFIPPPLVSANDLVDEDAVSGSAILNYDKRKLRWGWKAITVTKN